MSLNPMDMTGRTVLVTGASSGIGRETAVVMSQLGARVILSARNLERLEETRSRLTGEGHVVEPFNIEQCDTIPEWLKRLAGTLGPLDGIVHCAGDQQLAPLQIATPAKFEALMHLNVTSAVMFIKGFRQRGCASPGSGIVLLSSIAALAGKPGLAAYSASKAALIGLTKSAALELAGQQLRVNCIAPGHVEGEMAVRAYALLSEEQKQAIERMHPLGIGKPLDVAYAAAFLLSPCGRWITGSTLVVDGGYTAH